MSHLIVTLIWFTCGALTGGTTSGRQARDGMRMYPARTPVNLNGVPNERTAPFGGYKQSGNGREWGKYGMEDFLEVKAIAGA